MKLHFFTLILFSLSFSLGAQEFNEVDEFARTTPASKANSIKKLSQYLTEDFNAEKEKVRAIYIWIAENIRYSTATINNRTLTIEQRIKRQEPEKVIQSKRAVCEGYANLFEALCEASGIKSIIVTGYSKLPNGNIAPNGHAWNMVRVDREWKLMDVTWGAGGVDGRNGKYIKSLSEEFFLAEPIEFIQHHLPHDPLFQLLPNPIDFETFKRGVTKSENDILVSKNIHEKINGFYALSKAERLLETSKRAVEFDKKNGFANFTLSKHHYDKALTAYNLFFENSGEAFKRKLPLTDKMVDKWEAYLNQYKKELKKSEEYLIHIRPGDPISDAARQSKNAIRQAWKISKETDRQLNDYRRYLNKSGK